MMKFPTFLRSLLSTAKGRILFAGGLGITLGIFIFLVWKNGQITADAFINAPVITLRAPIPGRTTLEDGLQVGKRVKTGMPLASINANSENQRVSELRSLIADLGARHHTLLAEAEALVISISHRQRERSDLSKRAVSQATAGEDGAKAELALATAERDRAQAVFRQAMFESKRAGELHAAGFISDAALEKTSNSVQLANAGMSSENAREMRASTVLSAARKGLQIDGPRGLPYVMTRTGELSESVTDLVARKNQLAIQAASMEAELELLNKELSEQSQTQLKSPATGVVWSIDSNSGDAVARQGSVVQVVDCTSPWVEAFINEKDATALRQGDRVRVRAYHGEGEWDGEVMNIRFGTGRVTVGQSNVDPPPEVMRRQLPVRVSTARIRVFWTSNALAAPFCNVGRSVEIRRS